jgi:hypothetical protein
MASKLADIEGLLESECPIQWAYDNLREIGQAGETARIYEHPIEPGVVIRITDYPDGWFAYAAETMGRDDPSPHRPAVHEIGYHRGYYLALAARLDEIEEGSDLEAMVQSAIGALGRSGSVAEEQLAALDARQPGWREFAGTLRARCDLRPSNFLRDGDTLVFNDPYRSMSEWEAESIREHYTLHPRSASISPSI